MTVSPTGRRVALEEGPIRLENTDALILARQRQGLPLGDLDVQGFSALVPLLRDLDPGDVHSLMVLITGIGPGRA